MAWILGVAIRSLVGVFLALCAWIVARKVARARREGIRAKRRVELEPGVLAFAHGDGPSFLAEIGAEPRGRDRSVIEEIVLDYLRCVDGVERERLGAILDELGLVDEYADDLVGRSVSRRIEAAERLGLAGAVRVRERLLAAVYDESSDVRIRAATALVRLGGRSAVRPLVDALEQPDRWSTIQVAELLALAGRPAAEELRVAYPDLSPTAKVAAIEVLGRQRSVADRAWLEERLADPEIDVRARAAHALGELGDPASREALEGALSDEAWPVRAMAAKSLGRVPGDGAIRSLVGALRDREWWVRANSAESLRSVGPRGQTALVLMVGDDDPYASHQAVAKLEETGAIDREVRNLVRASDRDRRHARSLLGELVRAGKTERLEELAVRHPDRRVREGLADLLRGNAP